MAVDLVFFLQLSRLLQRGYVITVDYGSDYLNLQHKVVEGALLKRSGIRTYGKYEQCRGEASGYLQCLGVQDITSNVDFTELVRAGEGVGLRLVFYGPMHALERRFDSHNPNVGHLFKSHYLTSPSGAATTAAQGSRGVVP
jgi:hypothetical protein